MMKALCTRAVKCRSGTTSIEYSLIAALMSLAIYTGGDKLGDAVSGHFRKLSEKLSATDQQRSAGYSIGTLAVEPAKGGGGSSQIHATGGLVQAEGPPP